MEAIKQPKVIKNIERTIGLEGTALRKTTTDNIKDTIGVHLKKLKY